MSAETAPSALSSEDLARRIASVALDKKARDVVVLDMRDVVSYTDFLVIATGNTERQTHAIEEAVYQDLKHGDGDGRTPRRVEGGTEGRWILMDYYDADRAHLHARRTRVLPPRDAVGRGPGVRSRAGRVG